MKYALVLPLFVVLAACSDRATGPRARDVLASVPVARASDPVARASAPANPANLFKARKDQIDGYPCHECHDESMKPDNTERVLKESHGDVTLVHGAGRMWCTTCHGTTFDKDALVSLKGDRIDYDESYQLCGQCHFEKEREVLAGGHGKHLGTWRGEREIAACTQCHDAHDPAFKARKPWRGPDALR